MLVYQKTMFDRYYCIKSFCRLKTLGKPFKKFFLYYYNGGQKHERLVGFEKKACYRAKTYVNLKSLNYVHFCTNDDVNFCDGLECVYVKYKSRASTARELPDQYMGFAR